MLPAVPFLAAVMFAGQAPDPPAPSLPKGVTATRSDRAPRIDRRDDQPVW
jgi:hypothetical protein